MAMAMLRMGGYGEFVTRDILLSGMYKSSPRTAKGNLLIANPYTVKTPTLVHGVMLKLLLFPITSLLLDSTHALPSSIDGNGGGNYALNATISQTCAAKMDGKLPSFVPSNSHFSGNVRRYYIAAEEVEWDYAPTGWDNWLGVSDTSSIL
jgi:hypothetical protein